MTFIAMAVTNLQTLTDRALPHSLQQSDDPILVNKVDEKNHVDAIISAVGGLPVACPTIAVSVFLLHSISILFHPLIPYNSLVSPLQNHEFEITWLHLQLSFLTIPPSLDPR